MQMIRSRYGTHRATPEIWAEVSATYHGMISRLDDQFGRIVKKLDSSGLWDKTITMFFTDHGEYLGDHGLIEKWPSGLSETLVREPLIIGGGGIPSGLVRNSMAEMVDLVPTILQLCGIDETFPHNGKSLLPNILEDKPHREFAFSEGGFLLSEEPLLERASFPYDLKSKLQHEDTRLVGKAISMRDQHWTYIYRLYEPAELYDRSADPLELHNLAADPRFVHQARFMESQMFRWMVETSDLLPYAKDGRFPQVDLPDPKALWEKRKEERSNRPRAL
jgi:arylsulfatase A-like enzyme